MKIEKEGVLQILNTAGERPPSKEAIFALLKFEFDHLNEHIEMQKLMLWSISEKNKLLQKITTARSEFYKGFFRISEKFSKGTEVDFNVIIAISTSAIRFMVLNANANGNTIYGINFSSEKGKSRIFDAMSTMLGHIYSVVNSPRM